MSWGIIESKKIYCSACCRKINPGEQAYFDMDSGSALKIFCDACMDSAYDDDTHPFSADALGQD
jgi:RNase P subunit RPR2